MIKSGDDHKLKLKLKGDWWKNRSFKHLDNLLNLDKSRNIVQNLSMGMKS